MKSKCASQKATADAAPPDRRTDFAIDTTNSAPVPMLSGQAIGSGIGTLILAYRRQLSSVVLS